MMRLTTAASHRSWANRVGDDFREGKITLPVVLCYRRGSQEERVFWRRALEQGDRQEEDLEFAQRLLVQHQAIADTVERARHYGAIARDALAIFPASAHKSALLQTIEFCISRAH